MICPQQQHAQQRCKALIALASAAMVVWKALDALSHQLELCNIDAETRLVALLDPTIDPDRAALIRAAVARTGAEAVELRYLSAVVEGDSLLGQALDGADIVVTTSPLPDVMTPQAHVLELLDISPEEFPPHANLRRRVWALSLHLGEGSELVLTDTHGSNLMIGVAKSTVRSDHGLLDEDSTDAVFPSGWVETTPAPNTVNGTIVLMPGDANLGVRSLISSPVRLSVVDDMITAIDGDSPDSDMVRALLEYPGDPSAYGTAAITVGMNPHSQPLVPFDPRVLDPNLARLLAGSITMSFGDNLVADRPCPQILTFALAARSLTLDGLPVVTQGVLQGDFAPDVYEL